MDDRGREANGIENRTSACHEDDGMAAQPMFEHRIDHVHGETVVVLHHFPTDECDRTSDQIEEARPVLEPGFDTGGEARLGLGQSLIQKAKDVGAIVGTGAGQGVLKVACARTEQVPCKDDGIREWHGKALFGWLCILHRASWKLYNPLTYPAMVDLLHQALLEEFRQF